MSIRDIKLNVNGRTVNILTDPKKTLLKVLREDLKLTGTKQGCDEGLCGSCTVLVDGKPTNSCKLPVERVEGKNILTIEGVGTKDNPDIIQKAFVEVGAAQCGFCTPGMILNAKAILDGNPDPTREEVKKSIKRNLCRCTGYKKIIDGVLLAAEARKNPELLKEKDIKDLRLGGRIPQFNSWSKVTGTLRYAQDIYLEDMCHAKVLRSPYFHAKIKSINTAEAEAMRGVVAVATAADLKGPNRVKYIDQDFRVLADNKVRYFGEPVAIVVARTEQLAAKALEMIKVDYEELPFVTNPFDALKEGAPEVQEEDFPGNLLFHQNLVHGDIEEGFKEADFIEENDFYTPANAHGYLEPDAGVGYIDAEGRIVIYACGQAPHYHRDEIARVLGLGTDEVRVVEDGTGGGFGARIDPFIQLLLGLAVYKARVPVKLQFTTEENFIGSCKRHPFWIKLKTGVRKDGKIVAHYGEIVTDAGAYSLASPGVLMRAIVHSYGPYEIPNVKVIGKTVLTNNTPSSAMRGFGVSQMCFAIETQMNKICRRLNVNILDFAKLNGFRQGTVTATGQLIKDPPGYKEVIEAIENHWAKCEKATAPEKTAQLPSHIKRGKGFATTWYGIGKTGLLNLSRCNVEINQDGTLIVKEGAAEIGQGSTTVMGLIAAEEFGLTIDRVKVISADSLLTPDSDITCASKHTFYTGNATLLACRDLKKKLFEAAADELKASADDLETKDGLIFNKHNPEQQITFRDLHQKGCDMTGAGEFVVPLDLLDQETGQGKLYEVFTYGAAVVESEINTQTGEVKVLNAAVAFQVGKAINRLAMEGQMEGGVGMGVAFGLMEEYVTGKTRGFKDYPMPRSTDVPEMTTYVVEIPQGPGPFGAIGMGEAAHFPMAPAIIASMHDACGIWIHDLPATPGRVLEALKKKNA
ncbi:molybdopterin-dependent oxidoreductase [Desulfoscipio sp. XC116]|uniref:molybdopterin-dependent oxidoreductase n=1 Tax=Desulfoscipio sp. XC116 TaxID=3144975 RepID=UPI00325BE960